MPGSAELTSTPPQKTHKGIRPRAWCCSIRLRAGCQWSKHGGFGQLPASLVLALYSAAFVNTPLPQLGLEFLANIIQIADISLDPNIHYLLSNLGLDSLLLPVSALIGLALGVWIYRHRQMDIWYLLGVTTLA